jgi:NADH dehydrogenase/NADH:ubiquinone oxidoreductase subunit G
MKIIPAIFEDREIRRLYDEKSETWFFSVVDIVQVLTQQPDYKAARNYWKVLKNRLGKEGSQLVTSCNQLKLPAADGKKYLTNLIHQEWSGVSVKSHKELKNLKTQNLRDHMSEAELIFTALAELSTRQIAETTDATGMAENKTAAKTGGSIAKRARLELENQTGKSVVTGENYLPPSHSGKIQSQDAE